MLPVVGIERLADTIAACVMRDQDEQPVFSAEEVEALVREASTFSLLVGAKIGARRR